MLRDYVRPNPHLKGVMLAGHGIICWADSAKAAYEHTISLIADAARYLNAAQGAKPAFGGKDRLAKPRPRRHRRRPHAPPARPDDRCAPQTRPFLG